VVELHLAKVDVASSNLVSRSHKKRSGKTDRFFYLNKLLQADSFKKIKLMGELIDWQSKIG
jgi:hypothetical protein